MAGKGLSSRDTHLISGLSLYLFPYCVYVNSKGSIGAASADSVESDLWCASRVYFDNVTLMSQTPCQLKKHKLHLFVLGYQNNGFK